MKQDVLNRVSIYKRGPAAKIEIVVEATRTGVTDNDGDPVPDHGVTATIDAAKVATELEALLGALGREYTAQNPKAGLFVPEQTEQPQDLTRTLRALGST